MIDSVWVLLETSTNEEEDAVRVCGTYYSREDAARWSASRPTRSAVCVPLDGLAHGEAL